MDQESRFEHWWASLWKRPMDQKKKPELAEVNIKALKSGYYFGETAELFPSRYRVPPARHEAVTYRRVSGNGAIANGTYFTPTIRRFIN